MNLLYVHVKKETDMLTAVVVPEFLFFIFFF